MISHLKVETKSNPLLTLNLPLAIARFDFFIADVFKELFLLPLNSYLPLTLQTFQFGFCCNYCQGYLILSMMLYRVSIYLFIYLLSLNLLMSLQESVPLLSPFVKHCHGWHIFLLVFYLISLSATVSSPFLTVNPLLAKFLLAFTLHLEALIHFHEL